MQNKVLICQKSSQKCQMFVLVRKNEKADQFSQITHNYKKGNKVNFYLTF